LDFLVRTIRQEEEIKEYKLERKYSNYVILADDIILYLNDPKKFHQQTPRHYKQLHYSK
jgi:hypothetical protein